LPRSAAPLIAVTVLAAVFLFGGAQPASAHDSLVNSNPPADTMIDELPAELTLTFSAALIDGEGATAVEVTDASGTSVTDGEPVLDGALVTQQLVAQASAGEYHVVWRVVSSDGHPTSGEFSFTVTAGTPSEATTPPADETAAPTPTESSTPAPVAPDTETAPPASDGSDGSPWIWGISIVGILAAIGVATWLALRGRRDAGRADSDTPSEG
jgi:methionine-rich copper-binding protein CopC